MATYYGRNAGGAWNTATTWSTVSAKDASRVAAAATPTAADDVILDDYSGNITVNAGSVCKTLNCTSNGNYAGTLAYVAQTTTVSGSVTYASTMTITATSGGLTMNDTGTLTTNGKTLPGYLVFGGTSKTYTLAEAITVTGAMNINGTTLCTIATGGNNITVGGLTTIGVSTTMTGGGTVSGATMTIGAYTLTLASNWTMSGTLSLTNVAATFSGAFTVTCGTLSLAGFVRTLPDANIAFTSLQLGATTVNLTSDIQCTNFTQTGAPAINGVGLYLKISGNWAASTFGMTGTAGIKLNGTGAWSGTSTTGSSITGALVIDTAGTLTITDTVYFSGGIFTVTAGTVTGGTLNFPALTTFTQNGGTVESGLTFNAANYFFTTDLTTSGAIVFAGTSTISGAYTLTGGSVTINASCVITAGTNLKVTGNWTNNGTYSPYTPNTVTFDGTSTVAGATGFFNVTVLAGRTVSFTHTQTFSIYGTLTATGTGVSGITINSTSAGTAATLLFKDNSAFSGDYITFQDIAATGNSPIRTGANCTLTSGNSGIAYYAVPTLVITSNHTLQELYDYYCANRSSSTKLSELDFFRTSDGITYTCDYNLTVDGCVLSGSGKKINLGTNTFSAINGGSTTAIVTDVTGTIVPVSGVGLVASSKYEVFKADGTVLGSGTTAGTTFSFSYTHTVDVAVTLVVRKFGYLEARYTGTITTNGLEFNVSQVSDPNYAAYDADIADDFTISTIDMGSLFISHDAGTTVYTVKDLYNYSMDYFASLDRMQDVLPMSAQTPTNFTLLNSYTMDDTSHEFLSGGALTEDGGDILWSNLYTVGSQVAGTTLYAVQDGVALTGWWSTGNIDVLFKVKTGGSFIDSGNVTIYARKYGTLYDHNVVDLSNGGRVAAAISTSSDLNNQTSEVTVAGYSDIAKTEGVDDYDIGDGEGPCPYSVKFDAAGRTVQQLYEYLKYITRGDEDTYTIDGITGQIYTTINAAYGEVKTAPLGTFAGGIFFGAKGVWVEDIATADSLNYVLTDNNGDTHQHPAPPVAISVSGMVADSRLQIYDLTTDEELYNDVPGTSYSLEKEWSGDLSIRIRVKYTGASSAYLMWETTGTFTSTGLAVTANQVLDTTYATNGVDGSVVTECSVSGATIRIYVDDPDNTTTFQRVYNWYQYILATSGGIAEQDTSYFYAISPVEYRFDPDMKIVNQDTDNPLTITGANIAPVTGSASIIDNTNGASTVIYSFFPVDASGNLANLDAPVSEAIQRADDAFVAGFIK